MSTHFKVYCATCEESGPQIRRSGSVSFLPDDWVARDAWVDEVDRGTDQWHQFLSKHEFHDLRLKTGP
jgi:hypothetical protein